MIPTPLDLDVTLSDLPAEWPHDLLPTIQRQLKRNGRKLVVLDDDPTGTQTVHDVPVLTHWSTVVLQAEFRRTDVSAFYILTNSRSMPESEAITINLEIGRNLVEAAKITGVDFDIISRSDSTLRGHFPAEIDGLRTALKRPFDACLLMPFFLEGGRYTINNVHYVLENKRLIPAAATSFAQDPVFGFQSSDLRQWVTEKSNGHISTANIRNISIPQMRLSGPEVVTQILLNLPQNSVCIVNAASYRDVELFVCGLLEAEAKGKRYLYRSAASFVRVRAGLAERPLLTTADLKTNESAKVGGLIIAGSYVPKTTEQLAFLFKTVDMLQIEASVENLLDDTTQEEEISRISFQANQAINEGRDVAIFTSRGLITDKDARISLAVGGRVSGSLIQIVQRIQNRPRFLIAKGGITASDVATKGLNIQRALVLGQILPGIPVWRAGQESRFPDLPYIIFPGNIGGPESLYQVIKKLS